MVMDYHIHLEEGPYSFRWLERTAKALEAFELMDEGVQKGSKSWMEQQMVLLTKRFQQGCYSNEWLDLYLAQAKKLGLKEVGIVDHLYRFQETRHYFEKYMLLDNSDIGRAQRYWLDRVMTEKITDFVEMIVAAKERWRQQGVELKLGIEADYFIGGEEELSALLDKHPWDYIIGSVHFVDGWGFDNPQTAALFEQLDLKELYDRFFHTVESAIRSKLFDVVAHLDNLKVFGYKVDDISFNTAYYKRIANALVETDIATEVNAGLYYRYPVKEMCPGPTMLKVLIEHGVQFTVSSDSHFPDDVGKYVQQNTLALKDLGVLQIVGFEARKRKYRQL